MSNENFLKELKVGDYVAIRTRRFGGGSQELMGYQRWTVENITPKRTRIEVVRMCKNEDGSERVERMTFNAHGRYSDGERFSTRSYEIEALTKEVMASVIRDSIAIKAGRVLRNIEELRLNFKLQDLSGGDAQIVLDAAHTIYGVLMANKK